MPLPTDRPPTHPGEMLRAEFLEPLNLTPVAVAYALGVSPQELCDVCAGACPMTPELAVRLGRYLGMEPAFWLNLQQAFDLWYAERNLTNDGELARIAPLAR